MNIAQTFIVSVFASWAVAGCASDSLPNDVDGSVVDCTNGASACHGACVVTGADPNNCGACDHKCAQEG